MVGDFETNVDISADAEDEVSLLLEEVFHRAAEHVWISLPLVPEIDMKLTPKFNVTLDSYLDLKMSGAGSMRLGFDQSGTLDICNANRTI